MSVPRKPEQHHGGWRRQPTTRRPRRTRGRSPRRAPAAYGATPGDRGDRDLRAVAANGTRPRVTDVALDRRPAPGIRAPRSAAGRGLWTASPSSSRRAVGIVCSTALARETVSPFWPSRHGPPSAATSAGPSTMTQAPKPAARSAEQLSVGRSQAASRAGRSGDQLPVPRPASFTVAPGGHRKARGSGYSRCTPFRHASSDE